MLNVPLRAGKTCRKPFSGVSSDAVLSEAESRSWWSAIWSRLLMLTAGQILSSRYRTFNTTHHGQLRYTAPYLLTLPTGLYLRHCYNLTSSDFADSVQPANFWFWPFLETSIFESARLLVPPQTPFHRSRSLRTCGKLL